MGEEKPSRKVLRDDAIPTLNGVVNVILNTHIKTEISDEPKKGRIKIEKTDLGLIKHSKIQKCAVALCPSPLSAIYYSFPSAFSSKDLDLLKIWTDACKRTDRINSRKEKVCSIHFDDDRDEIDSTLHIIFLAQKIAIMYF